MKVDKLFTPGNYLIEEKENCFLVHRQLKKDELKNFNSNEIFIYEGKMFLRRVTNVPTEQHAINAVHFFWDALHELNFIERLEN